MTAVPHETKSRLARLREIVTAENQRQNLVAASSIDIFDERHLDDSAQLLPLLQSGDVVDIGSGGGFPGLVLAILSDNPIQLVESRKRRAAFLRAAVDLLDLPHAVVHESTVQRLTLAPVATITARAVASLTKLFEMASHLADEKTRWVLPKGRGVRAELELARRSWQGDFMLHPSRTDPEAQIVVATNVRRIAR